MSLTAATDTRFDAYFAKGYLELIEGDPVRHDSGNGVLVSEKFAELNGLSVGDAFTLKQSDVYDSAELKDTDTVTEVRVQGIFREVAESTAGFSGWSASNTMYCTYDTLTSVRPTTRRTGSTRSPSTWTTPPIWSASWQTSRRAITGRTTSR